MKISNLPAYSSFAAQKNTKNKDVKQNLQKSVSKNQVGFGENSRVLLNGIGEIGQALTRWFLAPRGIAFKPTPSLDRISELVRNVPGMDLVGINLSRDTHPDLFIPSLRNHDTLGWLQPNIDLVRKGKINYLKVEAKGEYPELMIPVFDTKRISELPLNDLGVDVVASNTGVHKTPSDLQEYLDVGRGQVKGVVLSCPPSKEKGYPEIPQYIFGVNHSEMGATPPDKIAAASCTTTAMAPPIGEIKKHFGIQWGVLSTTHAQTSSNQMVSNIPKLGKDLKKSLAAASSARSGLVNILDHKSGVSSAIAKIFPDLPEGTFTTIATRVPVIDVSVADLVLGLKKPATTEELKEVFDWARITPEGKDIFGYAEHKVGSNGHMGRHENIILIPDKVYTHAEGNVAVLRGWYDNVAGYSGKMFQLMAEYGNRLVNGK